MSLEARTEGEARFEAARRRIGKVLAPLGFFVLLLVPLPGLTPQAHALAAITVLTVTRPSSLSFSSTTEAETRS